MSFAPSSVGASALGKLGPAAPAVNPQDLKLREAFDDFVGQAFFGQMLKSMRKTVGESAYFHGGRGEEVFTEQLDQVLAEEMTKNSANSFTGPMFELFSLQRS